MSSLAMSIDKLEKQTKVLLSKIHALKHQHHTKDEMSLELMVPPSIRSQIYALIQSWGSLLWAKQKGNPRRVMYEANVQRGVLAANQLLDAVLFDDSRFYLNTSTKQRHTKNTKSDEYIRNTLRDACGIVRPFLPRLVLVCSCLLHDQFFRLV
jgi:hypothetical protein